MTKRQCLNKLDRLSRETEKVVKKMKAVPPCSAEWDELFEKVGALNDEFVQTQQRLFELM